MPPVSPKEIAELEKQLLKATGSRVAAAPVGGANNIVGFQRMSASAQNLSNVGNAAKTASNVTGAPIQGFFALQMASIIPTVLGWAGGFFGHTFGRLFDWAGNQTGKEFLGNAGARMHGVGDAVSNTGQTVSGVLNKPIQWAYDTPVKDAGESLANGAADLLNKTGNGFLKNQAENLRSVPAAVGTKFNDTVGKHIPDGVKDAVGNQNVYKGMRRGAAIAGSAAQNIHTISKFMHQIDALKEMYADMTGKDPDKVNVMELMFKKDVPVSVEQKRNQIKKQIGPAALMSALSNYISFKMAGLEYNMLGVGGGKLGATLQVAQMFLIPMANSALINNVIKDDKVLDQYHAMRQVHQQTGSLPADMIADLIVEASPFFEGLRPYTNRNSMEFNYRAADHIKALSVLAAEVGAHYAEQGASPSDVMHAIESGEAAAMVSQISRKLSQQAAAAQAPKTAGIQQAEPQGRVIEPQLTRSGVV